MDERDIEVRPEQLAEIAARLERNQQFNQEINDIINTQGRDVNIIRDNIQRAYSNIENNNRDLRYIARLR